MGFGAIITTGDANTPLPEKMMRFLTEVRVEEEIDKPTKFAVRFEDDLCEGDLEISSKSEITPNRMLSVIVDDGNRKACLVRGRITMIKAKSEVAGVGSWVEAHGEDRRVEMDRETVQANWTGPEKQIVSSILQGYGFAPDVANVQTKTYSQTEQLNQRGTDLALLQKIADENGVDFWISYTVGTRLPLVEDWFIDETAHFRISPTVPEGDPFSLAEFALTPDEANAPKFSVSVPEGDCPNVSTFRVTTDAERPNAARGAGINSETGQTEAHQSTASPSTTGEGRTLDALDDVTRTIITQSPGNANDQQRRNDAALRDASWFVEANLSTTSHLLRDRIVTTHQIVTVEGAGKKYSVAYQIKKVTHVINAAQHVMDCVLRANVIGEN